jgi:hypothetical protein
MAIHNTQPTRRYNNDYLSHKCPLNGASNRENKVRISPEGKDHEIKSSKRYRCTKFSRVCMVMGVLVFMESENGVISSCQELMPKDYTHRSGRQKKNLISSRLTLPNVQMNKKFTIPAQIINLYRSSN